MCRKHSHAKRYCCEVREEWLHGLTTSVLGPYCLRTIGKGNLAGGSRLLGEEASMLHSLITLPSHSLLPGCGRDVINLPLRTVVKPSPPLRKMSSQLVRHRNLFLLSDWAFCHSEEKYAMQIVLRVTTKNKRK